jgi:hypothetical protein
MIRIHLSNMLLLIILLIGISARLFGISWDNGYHLHPDERAIIMSVLELQFPPSLQSFFTPESTWNPHFFAYGSFPFYLLKVISTIVGQIDPHYTSYEKMNLVGRFLSALFDAGTMIVLFFLTKKIINKETALLAAFLYAISVLPIQLSHFYAVDTLLTFFILFTLYHLICFYEKATIKRAVFIGVCFGFALATKISATVLIAVIGGTIVLDFLLLFLRHPHRLNKYAPHIPYYVRRLLKYATVIGLATGFTFILLEPYAFIDFQSFWEQTQQQSAMTKNAFTFPYTLQYVGKIPYLYEIKNMVLYGLGIPLGVISLVGVFYMASIVKFMTNEKKGMILILLFFFFLYFLIVGRFAVGFMRYMLPLYPLLALAAAAVLMRVKHALPRSGFVRIMCITVLLLILLTWPLSFLQIYRYPNTRITASEWIYEYVKDNETIAVEHWDDELPIGGTIIYPKQVLALYEPDSPEKWQQINQQLAVTNYIVVASNRLYKPLMRLTNCEELAPHPCYPDTALYYKDLFSGKRGFRKVAEFSVYPTIPLLKIPINDEAADESFTVYDHPRVMIFQKI